MKPFKVSFISTRAASASLLNLSSKLTTNYTTNILNWLSLLPGYLVKIYNNLMSNCVAETIDVTSSCRMTESRMKSMKYCHSRSISWTDISPKVADPLRVFQLGKVSTQYGQKTVTSNSF